MDSLVPPHVTTPDDHDISRPRLRPLPLQSLLQLLNRNAMRADRTRRLSLLLLKPAQPINQDTAPDDTTPLAPVVDAVRITLERILMRQSVVVLARGLVRTVLQRVPLRAGLGVDVDLVVHADKADCLEINLLLVEVFAAEAGELDIVEGPVELDMLTRLDLAAGSFDELGSEQVQGCRRVSR